MKKTSAPQLNIPDFPPELRKEMDKFYIEHKSTYFKNFRETTIFVIEAGLIAAKNELSKRIRKNG